jgi:PAS domain S-box-containing protein
MVMMQPSVNETKTRQDLRKACETFPVSPAPLLLASKTPEVAVQSQIQLELEMQNEELRETQALLEEARDKFMDLYDFAPVGYLTLNRDALITEANLTATKLLGTVRGNLVNERIRKFVPSVDLDRWDQYFVSILHNREKQECELRFRKGDGSFFSARLESIRLDRDSPESVIRMTVSDITDRVRTEYELVRKSHTLDDLTAAYGTIAAGQETLRHAYEELSAREGDLTKALAEKEVLLAEIHHRVKNNLTAFISLLDLETSNDASPSGVAFKKDLQNRARSMALVHETLYRTKEYTNVAMDVYLTSLAERVAATFSGKGRIGVAVEATGVTLDIARATPCGLIINELITNSFKYAFPESFDPEKSRQEPCTVRIEMTKEDDLYQLKVSDNGVGLPPGIDPKATQTLGLKLVNFLARHQLRATVSVRRDLGTEYLIRFGPMKAPVKTA